MIIMILSFLLIGIAMILYASVNLFKIFSCKKQIDAYCMGKDRRLAGFRRGRDSFWTFSYRYDGKDYYRESKLGVTVKLHDSLVQGEKYSIYINEKNPQVYVVERKATITEILYIVMGVIILGLAIFSYVFFYHADYLFQLIY